MVLHGYYIDFRGLNYFTLFRQSRDKGPLMQNNRVEERVLFLRTWRLKGKNEHCQSKFHSSC